MVTDKNADAHAERMYNARRRSVRRQLIPPIVFFLILAAVIIGSVIGYRRTHQNGEVDMTSYAMEVDYVLIGLDQTVYENVDRVDRSYGDYFYIGAEFYELRTDIEYGLFNEVGVLWYDGVDTVTTMRWVSDDPVSEEFLADAAEEMETALGAYEEEADGSYSWHADADGVLGDNTDVAWVTFSRDEDGHFVIEGEALEEEK